LFALTPIWYTKKNFLLVISVSDSPHKRDMADHGCFNFYTQFEYEPYQQYQQYPSEDERITNVKNTLNIFMQQSMINM